MGFGPIPACPTAVTDKRKDVKVFFMERIRLKTVVLSDIHLGTKFSKVTEVTDFLTSVDCDRLIFNGDTIDGWQLRKNDYQYWGAEQARFFRVILKMMENHGTEVIFLRGIRSFRCRWDS